MRPQRALSLTRQRLSWFVWIRPALVRLAIGAGILAGPLLSQGWAKYRPKPDAKAAQTDTEATPNKPLASAIDLSLSKEGERKAQALAHFADGFIGT